MPHELPVDVHTSKLWRDEGDILTFNLNEYNNR